MPRKRQRRRAQQARPEPAATQAAAPQRSAGLAEWRWTTFPVFFAFVSGMLVAFIVIGTNETLAVALFYGALFGVGYGLAHMFVRNVLVAGRLRRQRATQRDDREEQEEETEEELVYPDEQSR